jgi:hypothetical protein
VLLPFTVRPVNIGASLNVILPVDPNPVAVTLAPTKSRIVIDPALPTIVPSSLTVIPLINPSLTPDIP